MKKVVGYYSSWAHWRKDTGKYSVDDIPVEGCTDVIYAFAGLDPGRLKIKEEDPYLEKDEGFANYRKFTRQRKRNFNAKMLLSLGGWKDSQSNKYSRLVADRKSRADFISDAVKFLKDYNFDGLDLDWEYPQSSDREGFTRLVQELREAFKAYGLKLTAAVPAGGNAIDQRYDVPALTAALDQIHVMAYDFHGSQDRQVAHHAPLYPAPGQPEAFCADFAIKNWIEKGAEPSKLFLGVPFYGRSWTTTGSNKAPGAPASAVGEPGPLTQEAGILSYYEICSAHGNGGWQKVNDSAGPYLTKGNQWVGYDDINAIAKKTRYAKQKGLGGVMIWDITMDDFRNISGDRTNPLLRTILKNL